MNALPRLSKYSILGVLLLSAGILGTFSAGLADDDFFQSLRGRGGGLSAQADSSPLEVSAEFKLESNGRRGVLSVTATIEDGYHTYSITQPPKGPIRSRITVGEVPGVSLAGEFAPDKPPEVKHDEKAFKDVPLEEHHHQVTWNASIELAEGTDPTGLTITGKLFAQVCSDQNCLQPKHFPFSAQLAQGAPPRLAATRQEPAPRPAEIVRPKSANSLRPTVPSAGPTANQAIHPMSGTVVRGWIEPKEVTTGGTIKVVLEVQPGKAQRVYALAERDTSKGKVGVAKPTLIVLTETSGAIGSPAIASQKAVEKASESNPGEVDRFYEGTVQFEVDLAVPSDPGPGPLLIKGVIGYQTCDESCYQPLGLRFEGVVPVGSKIRSGRLPLVLTAAAGYREAASLAEGDADESQEQAVAAAPLAAGSPPGPRGYDSRRLELREFGGGQRQGSLAAVLYFAFLGGVILNVMPCVLPVIGLKILSFVEQSGHERGRILRLNLWFTLGLVSVFLVLATLAVILGLNWGEQHTSKVFNIVMASLVFVMALSLLGVWEIPIPGFVGHGAATNLAAREGASGAFAKGVMSTILAVPCSGPFLGPVFGYTITQSPAAIYAIFLSIGLGMASPYLLIGAFPELIRWLPKPGAWMNTFKHMMGFLLLGTVVYFFSIIGSALFIPTFAFLIGLWAAFWWIGRTPLYADLPRRLRAWGEGAVFATAVGLFAFIGLRPGENELAWQTFSQQSLSQHIESGKTVLIDFTADWCPNCKVNERFVLNTAPVKKLVDQYGIVPLKADLTDGSEEINSMLEILRSKAIPVYAIFPAADPNRPLILRDLVTKSQVLAALREAGPSRDSLEATSTAMK